MKKLISLAICLCLVLGVLAGCGQSKVEPYEETETTEATGTELSAEAEPAAAPAADGEPAAAEETHQPAGIGLGGTGYETYPADTVVATVNGTDVTWMEYYYWLRYYTLYVQQVAAQYGVVLDGWDANDLSADNTNADVVLMNAKTNLIQDHVIQTEVAKLGVALSAEDEATVLDVFEQNADQVTGDNDGTATEEEIAAFEDYLNNEMFVDRAFFDQFNATAILSQKGFEETYGANGEKFSDEETLAFAEQNGLMGAKHILLMTIDPDTREALTDEEIAEKRAIIEDLNTQLQAVKDDKSALIALFDQLTAEYTEDTGYASYPEGYVFSQGEMVESFENAVKELDEDYGLSDIVESEYGLHIILRIPVDPDAIIGTDANGNDVGLRYAAATQEFTAQIQEWVDSAEVVWNDGFETPDLAAIFG